MDNVVDQTVGRVVGMVDPVLAEAVTNKIKDSRQYHNLQDKVNDEIMGSGLTLEEKNAQKGPFSMNGGRFKWGVFSVKNGGSFKHNGGSFKHNGGSFKGNGFVGGEVKVYEDNSPFLRPDQNGFNPLKPKSLKSQKGE